ncbi:MAG: hypothetical protein IJB39_02785 [Alistipes sp.]|nr:hypothetical protein [Alistipes sp.]
MRNLLLYLFLFGCVGNVFAQDVSLSQGSESVNVDSLSNRLYILQHNYDYLYCDYQLNRANNDALIFSNTVSIKSNELLINCYVENFDKDLYQGFKKYYDASVEYFDTLKDKIDSTKQIIDEKIDSSNFSSNEKVLLLTQIISLEMTIKQVESSLDYFGVILGIYEKRM